MGASFADLSELTHASLDRASRYLTYLLLFFFHCLIAQYPAAFDEEFSIAERREY